MTKLQQQIIDAINSGKTENESRFQLYKLGMSKGWSNSQDETKEQYFVSCAEMSLDKIKENPNRMFETRHKYGDTLPENEAFNNQPAPQQSRVINYSEWKKLYNLKADDSLYTLIGWASSVLGLDSFNLFLQNSKNAHDIQIIEEPITYFRNNLDKVIAQKRKEQFSKAMKRVLNLVNKEAIDRHVNTQNFSDFVAKLNQSRYLIDELNHDDMDAAGFVVIDIIDKTISARIIR